MRQIVENGGYEYSVSSIQFDDDGIPYVEAWLFKPWNDTFYHYPWDMLTPEQQDKVRARMDKWDSWYDECDFLEGEKCATLLRK